MVVYPKQYCNFNLIKYFFSCGCRYLITHCCATTCSCFLDSVCHDHDPDILCCGLAVWLPNGLALFPDQLYDHSHYFFCKLLCEGRLVFFLLFYLVMCLYSWTVLSFSLFFQTIKVIYWKCYYWYLYCNLNVGNLT